MLEDLVSFLLSIPRMGIVVRKRSKAGVRHSPRLGTAPPCFSILVIVVKQALGLILSYNRQDIRRTIIGMVGTPVEPYFKQFSIFCGKAIYLRELDKII